MKKNWWDSKFINACAGSAFMIAAHKFGCDPVTVGGIGVMFGFKIKTQGDIDVANVQKKK